MRRGFKDRRDMEHHRTVRSLYYLKAIKDIIEYLEDVPAGDGGHHIYPRSWLGISRDKLLEVRKELGL